MKLSLTALARLVAFDVVRDGEFSTLGFLSMPRPGILTFVESRRVLKAVRSSPRPLGVITTPDIAPELPQLDGVALAANPRRTFYELHNHLARHTDFYGGHAPTIIDPAADVHPTASIASRDVQIGPRAVVGPHVTILGRCRIGADVVLHPGVVLGAEGFQTSRFDDGVLDMAHAGGIHIGDGVTVHANAVVARALFDEETVIGEGSRIGNLAFVSHNAQIGRHCFIGHGAVVNGNVVIGEDSWIGPGSTLCDRLCIGAGARITLGAAVIHDVAPGQQVTGNVAVEHRKFLRHIAAVNGRRA
ncbi:MAG TPA: DapH/DapD/GlmU-related protein [Vicinamibacterales bacterium]|jgi:UDP-3-O-[3-hydroxymyristoyl] glucosamine N-acyltransferase